MLPELFSIFGLTLHTFGVMVATGFLTGMWWCRREAERLGYPVERVMDLTFWLMIWGLIGARGMFIMVNWDMYAQFPAEILYVWKGGLVWYGGLIAAFAAGVVMMRRYSLPVWATADLVAPGVMYGLAFGRLGCLAAGDDHGRLIVSALGPKAQALHEKGLLFNQINGRVTAQGLDTIHAEGFTRPWWALIFDGRSLVQPDLVGLPLYPTQIIMSLYCVGIFAILVWMRRIRRFDGQIVASMLMIYAVARFLLEYLRGDLGRGFWMPGVSTSQGVSILIFATGLALFVWLRQRNLQQAPPPLAT